MSDQTTHVQDEDLVQRLDGELASARRDSIDAHLAECDACRTRLTRFYAVSLAIAGTPPSTTGAGHRARARLTLAMQQEAEHRRTQSSVRRVLSSVAFQPRWALGAAAALACAAWLGLPGMQVGPDAARTPGIYARPIVSLTPGATWDISRAQVCGSGAPKGTVVAEHVRHKVVAAYGMTDVPRTDYELDYLITPELGGAPDARNLWPQRYDVPGWNARVKDQLEGLLPTLVCQGRVDLATAQREMATDWIAAYRKYFRSDVPLPPAAADLADDDALVFGVIEGPCWLAAAPTAKIRVLRTRSGTAQPGRFRLLRI